MSSMPPTPRPHFEGRHPARPEFSGRRSSWLDYGADEDCAIAALLHDVLEDGGPQFAPRIEQQFGSRVLAIVEGCTDGLPDADGQKSDWATRKRAYLAHLEAASADVLLVSGADKLHNARAIVSDLQRHGPSVFSRFAAGQEGTLWYYRNLAELFERRGAPVARALNSEVAKMLSLAT